MLHADDAPRPLPRRIPTRCPGGGRRRPAAAGHRLRRRDDRPLLHRDLPADRAAGGVAALSASEGGVEPRGRRQALGHRLDLPGRSTGAADRRASRRRASAPTRSAARTSRRWMRSMRLDAHGDAASFGSRRSSTRSPASPACPRRLRRRPHPTATPLPSRRSSPTRSTPRTTLVSIPVRSRSAGASCNVESGTPCAASSPIKDSSCRERVASSTRSGCFTSRRLAVAAAASAPSRYRLALPKAAMGRADVSSRSGDAPRLARDARFRLTGPLIARRLGLMSRFTPETIERVREAPTSSRSSPPTPTCAARASGSSASARSTTSAPRRSRSSRARASTTASAARPAATRSASSRRRRASPSRMRSRRSPSATGSRSRSSRRTRGPRRRAAAAAGSARRCERAAAFYESYLWESPKAAKAREYLTGSAGWARRSLRAFGVGFAPSAWDSVADPRPAGRLHGRGAARGRADPALPEGPGSHYDRFRARIMFPVRDHAAASSGFGARGDGRRRASRST